MGRLGDLTITCHLSTANHTNVYPLFVEPRGNPEVLLMVVTIEELDYDTEYYYVAFVTTSENETFYGLFLKGII